MTTSAQNTHCAPQGIATVLRVPNHRPGNAKSSHQDVAARLTAAVLPPPPQETTSASSHPSTPTMGSRDSLQSTPASVPLLSVGRGPLRPQKDASKRSAKAKGSPEGYRVSDQSCPRASRPRDAHHHSATHRPPTISDEAFCGHNNFAQMPQLALMIPAVPQHAPAHESMSTHSSLLRYRTEEGDRSPSASSDDGSVHSCSSGGSGVKVHSPYGAHREPWQCEISIDNAPFARFGSIAEDVAMLCEWITRVAIPSFLGMGADLAAKHDEGRPYYDPKTKTMTKSCPPPHRSILDRIKALPDTLQKGKYYVQFVAMSKNDAPSFLRNDGEWNAAKRRHCVVKTNFPFLLDLLRSPLLFILPDHNGLRVCWHGYSTPATSPSTSASSLPSDRRQHNADVISNYCLGIRNLGLRHRHRVLNGLPSAVKLDMPTPTPAHQWAPRPPQAARGYAQQ